MSNYIIHPYFCHSVPVHHKVLPSLIDLQVYPFSSVHCLMTDGSATATCCSDGHQQSWASCSNNTSIFTFTTLNLFVNNKNNNNKQVSANHPTIMAELQHLMVSGQHQHGNGKTITPKTPKHQIFSPTEIQTKRYIKCIMYTRHLQMIIYPL